MSTKELTNEKQTISVSEIAITGVCIALTFIATGFINIRLPIAANGGLVHLGNVPLFLAQLFLENVLAHWLVRLEWHCSI